MKVISAMGVLLVLALVLVGCFSPQQHFNKADITSVVPNVQKFRDQNFTILLLGIDARKQEVSRTDAIMLARVNPLRGKVSLVSIPRDTRVYIAGVGYTKINHAHFLGEQRGGTKAGTKAAIEAVSNLCKCDINYYIKINFQGFEKFIDTLGGVELELPQPVTLTYAGITLPAGQQRLNGSTALDLVRERESLKDGDFGRQRNQALVLKALVRQMGEPQNLQRLPLMVKQLKEEVIDMNLSETDLISLAWVIKDISPEHVSYQQIPGHDGYALDPLLNKRLYYWIPD